MEYIFNIMMPICSHIAGRRIERMNVIFDLQKVNFLTLFDSKVKKLINISSKISQDYYPEALNKAIILNASTLFYGVWSVIQAFLDKKTVERFTFLKSNYHKALDEMMEKKDIPSFYGGEDLSLLRDQPGPWKEEILSAKAHHRLELQSREYFF